MQPVQNGVMMFNGITPDKTMIMPDDPVPIQLAKERIAEFAERLPYIQKIDKLAGQVPFFVYDGADFLNLLKTVATTDEITGLRVYFALNDIDETVFLLFAPTARGSMSGTLSNDISDLCDKGDYHIFKQEDGGIAAIYQIEMAVARQFVLLFRKGTTLYLAPWIALGRQMGDGIDSKCMWYSKQVIKNTYEHLTAPGHPSFGQIYAFFAGYKKENDVHEINLGGDIGPVLVDKPKHLTLIFSTERLEFADPDAYDTAAPCPPDIACGNNELP